MSVYLFGSQAGGDTHRESDVDVGVLLDFGIYPDREHRFDARLRLCRVKSAAPSDGTTLTSSF